MLEVMSTSGSLGHVPVGGIIMWSGTIAALATYPNWKLCDGTANAPGPDLRDRFIVGATSDDAGVAKTNLTGSLTQSGGAVTHHHADHGVTQPVVSAHTLTQPVVSAHSITQPVVSAHTLTQPAISAHSVTQPAIDAHTVATAGARTSGASSAAVVTSISTHTLGTSVAVSAHTLSTNVGIDAHALTTNVAVSDHALTTQVGVDAHALTTNVGVSTHDTLSAPMPFWALAFIQRMS